MDGQDSYESDIPYRSIIIARSAVGWVLALFAVGDVYVSVCKKKCLRSIWHAAKVASAILL